MTKKLGDKTVYVEKKKGNKVFLKEID